MSPKTKQKTPTSSKSAIEYLIHLLTKKVKAMRKGQAMERVKNALKRKSTTGVSGISQSILKSSVYLDSGRNNPKMSKAIKSNKVRM